MVKDYYNGALGFYSKPGLSEHIFEAALSQWTERPQLDKRYNKRKVQFYDALIWTRVINARRLYKNLSNPIKERKKQGKEYEDEAKEFPFETQSSSEMQQDLDELMESINTWKYSGKVYRVMNCMDDKIDYHNMIASWTNDPEVFRKFNHLLPDKKYTFLIGNTGKDWGFDVNKYRKNTGNRHKFTEKEQEIILPMNSKYVKDIFYGTLEEFYKYIKKSSHN